MTRPLGKLIVSYGGGVDSVACLIHLRKHLNEKPTAIVMADPGSERAATMIYLREWMNERLRRWGWPLVEVISRKQEARFRDRAWRYETLEEECKRMRTLPSIAYGPKKCSQKYKGEPQRWWLARQSWAQSEWAAGRKLVRVIGYDFDEGDRVQRSVAAMIPPPPRPAGFVGKWPTDVTKWERPRFHSWFPLFESRLNRDQCEALIRSERMPVPPKSSCKFCPANTIEEWRQFRNEDPAGFAAAVEMSRRAIDGIESPDVVGLMRCNPHGQRQLHEWVDGLYGDDDSATTTPAQSCECSI